MNRRKSIYINTGSTRDANEISSLAWISIVDALASGTKLPDARSSIVEPIEASFHGKTAWMKISGKTVKDVSEGYATVTPKSATVISFVESLKGYFSSSKVNIDVSSGDTIFERDGEVRATLSTSVVTDKGSSIESYAIFIKDVKVEIANVSYHDTGDAVIWRYDIIVKIEGKIKELTLNTKLSFVDVDFTI